MKRVTFVTDAIPVGGNKTFIENCARELQSRKYQVNIIYFSPGKDFSSINFKQVKKFHLPIFEFGLSPKKVFLRAKSLFILERKLELIKNSDLIIADLVAAALPLIIVTKLLGIKKKMIYQFHGSNTLEVFFIPNQIDQFYNNDHSTFFGRVKKTVFFYLEKLVLISMSQIIVFSQYSQGILINNFGISRSKIFQLKPGIDESFFYSTSSLLQKKVAAKAKLGFNKKKKILFIPISRFEERKGVFFLMRLIRDLPDSYFQKYTLLLSSDFAAFPDATNGFFESVKNYSLGNKILLIHRPTRQELSNLYLAADLTILPSLDLETFGLVTIESHVHGTPVVALDIGANRETIKNSSYLIKAADKNLLLKLIPDILSKQSSKLILKLAEETKNTYSWRRYVSQILQIQKEYLSNTARNLTFE